MDYHDDTSELTKTQLLTYIESPMVYYHTYVTRKLPRKAQTKEMLSGVILHAMFLEGKRLDDLVGVYPESCLNKNGGLIGATAAKHRAANPASYWLKEAERDTIRATYENLKDSSIGHAIAECSEFEKTVRASVYGRNCKCRPDIAGDVGEYWMVYDLKFTDTIGAFVRSSRTLKYWLQDAHYSAVIREATGKQVVFKFIAAETVFPYRVRVHSYNPIKREMAARFHKSRLLDLMASERSGDWNDRVIEDLPLSPWDCGEGDDVLMDDDALKAMNESVDETEVMESPF